VNLSNNQCLNLNGKDTQDAYDATASFGVFMALIKAIAGTVFSILFIAIAIF
jgi:hypothetical protein